MLNANKTTYWLLKTKLINYGLRNVPGQNIPKYNTIWLEVAGLLRAHRIDISDLPHRLYLQYTDEQAGTPMLFRQHFHTLKSTQSAKLLSLPLITTEAEEQYDSLVNDRRWHPVKKQPSGFHTLQPGQPGTNQGLQTVQPGTPRTHDAQGRPIDRNPPRPGTPQERKNILTGQDESWCGQCGRWGNHATNKHNEWETSCRHGRGRNGRGNRGGRGGGGGRGGTPNAGRGRGQDGRGQRGAGRGGRGGRNGRGGAPAPPSATDPLVIPVSNMCLNF